MLLKIYHLFDSESGEIYSPCKIALKELTSPRIGQTRSDSRGSLWLVGDIENGAALAGIVRSRLVTEPQDARRASRSWRVRADPKQEAGRAQIFAKPAAVALPQKSSKTINLANYKRII